MQGRAGREGHLRLVWLQLSPLAPACSSAGLVQLTALSNLTALDLGYSCWAHTPAGLRRLVGSSTLRGLQMLNVGGCEGTCDDVLEAVAGLMQLTMLDVSECQRVTQR